MKTFSKEEVKEFWDAAPCGTSDVPVTEGKTQFSLLDERRYQLEPFIPHFAKFEHWTGKKVLEIGCGTGGDLIRFSLGGANTFGVDLSPNSVALANKRFEDLDVTADVREADAENLPFDDKSFDFVYSWGVIHHTPSIENAISQIYRVLKPGAEFCVMIYHKRSLFIFQCWLMFGLFKRQPFRSIDEILANHVESPGTQAYTREEAKGLFSRFQKVNVETVITPYDARIGRRKFLSPFLRSFIPNRLGWFMVVSGRRGVTQ